MLFLQTQYSVVKLVVKHQVANQYNPELPMFCASAAGPLDVFTTLLTFVYVSILGQRAQVHHGEAGGRRAQEVHCRPEGNVQVKSCTIIDPHTIHNVPRVVWF